MRRVSRGMSPRRDYLSKENAVPSTNVTVHHHHKKFRGMPVPLRTPANSSKPHLTRDELFGVLSSF